MTRKGHAKPWSTGEFYREFPGTGDAALNPSPRPLREPPPLSSPESRGSRCTCARRCHHAQTSVGYNSPRKASNRAPFGIFTAAPCTPGQDTVTYTDQQKSNRTSLLHNIQRAVTDRVQGCHICVVIAILFNEQRVVLRLPRHDPGTYLLKSAALIREAPLRSALTLEASGKTTAPSVR
eukprot:scaffold841_cov397-Prasinococcus_capsulatus_cf.AAC.12